VAVTGNTIVAVWTTTSRRTFTGPKTRVVDLGGRFLLPGFIDGHTHFNSAGRARHRREPHDGGRRCGLEEEVGNA
jgi:predicted amidohydrolase YtcJ